MGRRAERRATLAAWLNSKVLPNSSQKVNEDGPAAPPKTSDVKSERETEELNDLRSGTSGTVAAPSAAAS